MKYFNIENILYILQDRINLQKTKLNTDFSLLELEKKDYTVYENIPKVLTINVRLIEVFLDDYDINLEWFLEETLINRTISVSKLIKNIDIECNTDLFFIETIDCNYQITKKQYKISEKFNLFLNKNNKKFYLKNGKVFSSFNFKIPLKKEKIQKFNFYGGVKSKNKNNLYEQQCVQFYLKNNQILTKKYKLDINENKYSEDYLSGENEEKCSNLRDFFQKGKSVLFLEYSKNFFKNIKYDPNQVFEYESFDLEVLDERRGLVNVKFKLKTNKKYNS